MKRERRNCESGSVMVEMCVALPLLLLVTIGIADFGRMFSQSVAVQQAARAGSQFTTLDRNRWADTAGAAAAARAEIPELTGATVTAVSYCACNWGSPTSCSNSCTIKRRYMDVTVTSTFRPMVGLPGIPQLTTVVGRSTVRLQ